MLMVTNVRGPGNEAGSNARLSKTLPVFVARGLSKEYQMGEVRVMALRGIDLDLYEGDFVVFLGPSGSGKSTLLNILGGLDVPSSGEVRFRDHDLTVSDDDALTQFRRDHVGFVFQFYNLIPSLTALENVALVADIAANPLPPEEALQIVGLGDRMSHFPSQLSGGEQQRVAVARAIAKRPEVLLCDEPTGALDVHTGVVVLEAIERANRELGTTTVVITHNAAIAAMADRVVTLSDGRIAGVTQNSRKTPPPRTSLVNDAGPQPKNTSRCLANAVAICRDRAGHWLRRRHAGHGLEHARLAATYAGSLLRTVSLGPYLRSRETGA